MRVLASTFFKGTSMSQKVLEQPQPTEFSARLKELLQRTDEAVARSGDKIPTQTGRGSSWAAQNWKR